MVTQTDTFDVGGCMEGVPLGLRNRRRIWRILAEMVPLPLNERKTAEELGVEWGSEKGDDDDDDDE